MATVLEECTAEEQQRSVVRFFFCWQKCSMQRIFIKKYFLFTVGSVCHVKRFKAGRQKFHRWRRGWNGGADVAETTVKRLLCCEFRRTGKAIGHVYRWWRICRWINVFFPCFTFYINLWAIYCLSLVPHTGTVCRCLTEQVVSCSVHLLWLMTLPARRV
jgi:hypothetical protein